MSSRLTSDVSGQVRYSRADFDKSPLIVFYELTRACDLVCQHCRACAQPAADPNELSPVFRSLRDPNALADKCGVCDDRHVCGGSRARAYALTGDPLAEELDCLYTPRPLI